jgi:hypothetical protein
MLQPNGYHSTACPVRFVNSERPSASTYLPEAHDLPHAHGETVYWRHSSPQFGPSDTPSTPWVRPEANADASQEYIPSTASSASSSAYPHPPLPSHHAPLLPIVRRLEPAAHLSVLPEHMPTYYHSHGDISAASVSHEPQASLIASAETVTDSSGVDLMQHYANVDREIFQTPCQLLASLLVPGLTNDVRLVPSVESNKDREEVKRNETLRQARRREVAQSVGFEPTDPYVRSP